MANLCTYILLISAFLQTIFAEIDSVDLCSYNATSDFDEYTTGRTETCDCSNPMKCIRKCCRAGFYHRILQNLDTKIFKGVCIKNLSTTNFSVPTYDGTTKKSSNADKFIIGMLQCNKGELWRYFKMNDSNPNERYYVQQNGTLYYPASVAKFYNNDRFCVDEGGGLSVYLCYSLKQEDYARRLLRKVNSSGMIISMPFLLITFLVYAILPEKNLHRKALMSYVLTLLLGYILLVSVQLYTNHIDPVPCNLLGYLIIFFFLVSFFWMNVMCLDMWLAFSGIRGFHGKKNAEQKRFLYYCCYAWGMPTLHVLMVYLLNTYSDEDAIYNPQIAKQKCFLGDGFPNLFYFYLPMAILIGINIALFIITALKIQKAKKETAMLKHSDSKRHSYEDDKQKFNLYLKLLFAMGINWTMEIISWAIIWKMGTQVPSYVWYLTDFINAMYGVFIFFIFVFKRKIWRSLKKRFYICLGRPHLAQAMTSTRTTRTSNYSTTDTTANTNDYRMNEIQNGRGEERALNMK